MRLTRKKRVMTALLGAAVASGVTTLILILVEATNVFLPTDIKVHPQSPSGGGWAGLSAVPGPRPADSGVTPSLGSYSMPGPPTHPSLCIGGPQTRRMTRVWSARPWPAGQKVSGQSC